MTPTRQIFSQWDDAIIPLIAEAMRREGIEKYSMSCGSDREMARCLTAAIDDQLIDSRLEAVHFDASTVNDGYGARHHFGFDPASLAVLVRRLAQPLAKHWEEFPSGDDEQCLGDAMQSLAGEILDTLGIEAEFGG
jgi:hypothetical protein